jgi:hypothetical protein
MVLTPHMLVGAAVGLKVKNLGAIWAIATLLHFLLDRLPHFEYSRNENFRAIAGRNFFRIFRRALLDLLVGIIALAWVLRDSLFSISVWAGVLSSLWPDGLIFLYAATRLVFQWESRILKGFYSFHEKLHIRREKNGWIQGLILEGLVVLLSLVFIVSNPPLEGWGKWFLSLAFWHSERLSH